MLTRKHFIKFAEVIAELKEEHERERTIELLSPVFRSINERFNEARFREYIQKLIRIKQ